MLSCINYFSISSVLECAFQMQYILILMLSVLVTDASTKSGIVEICEVNNLFKNHVMEKIWKGEKEGTQILRTQISM